MADAHSPSGRGGDAGASAPTAAVVVTTYNHAHFLADALTSIAGQTRAADEVIVVDDGSDDDPAAVVRRFPGVRLVRTVNQGLAAARNAGLGETRADFVLFLDADDVLAPGGIEAGLACMAANPGAAFVYGAHRRVDASLRPLSGPHLTPVGARAAHAFLGGNIVGMHATALFDRAKLQACGGFDPALRRCEDYDAYLRVAARHRVASHSATVADYRIHGDNMSRDADDMLAWALTVHARHRPPAGDAAALRAWRRGTKFWTTFYANAVWRPGGGAPARRVWRGRLRALRIDPLAVPGAVARRIARRFLSPAAVYELKRRLGRSDAPAVGRIDFGDLARITPVDPAFGYARGTPIDRHYIEQFLARHAPDIRGRVLEVGDAAYCRRFGEGVTRQDVLNVSPGAPETTILGDLSQPGILPEAAFDCLVIVQTLQFIYDFRVAVAELRRALRPGGILLLTVPGISPVDRGEFRDTWYWSLTPLAAQRLFGEAFGPENVEVTAFGNAFAATCFLQGIAREDVDPAWLEPVDPALPVVVAVRARAA